MAAAGPGREVQRAAPLNPPRGLREQHGRQPVDGGRECPAGSARFCERGGGRRGCGGEAAGRRGGRGRH